LKFFAGFEADSFAGRDVGYFSRSRIATNAALARFDDEHAKSSQLDPLAALQSILHRLEQRFDGSLSFDFWNAGLVGNMIYNIKLDHF